MAGLQDLLILRQLQDQADPVRSAFASFAEGVSGGIETARAEQKVKKDEADAFTRSLQRLDTAKTQFGDKFDVSLDKGRVSISSKKIPAGSGTKDIFTVDASEGGLTKVGTVPKSAQVFKEFLSPELAAEKTKTVGEAKIRLKDIETTQKLTSAVKRLGILNKQFNEALPTGDKTPIEQRISGNIESFAARVGLTDNSKLLALKKNARPIAINLIRAFGEVGNLSETEQKGALDVVSQEGITEKERSDQVRQFVEFALAGSSPDSIEFLRNREDIKGILDAYGIDIDSFSGAGSGLTPLESIPEGTPTAINAQGDRMALINGEWKRVGR